MPELVVAVNYQRPTK